jgi:stage II sporulation protein D
LAENAPHLIVAADGPCTIRRGRGDVVHAAPEPLPETTVPQAGPEGTPTAFGVPLTNDGLDMVPADGLAFRVAVGSDGDFHRYQGILRLLPGTARGVNVVNVVPMEVYLRGVVPSEMPDRFEPAALAAQAIAARTYAFYQRNTHDHDAEAWDVRADEGSQVYTGLEHQGDAPRAVRAVERTRGIVSTWAAPDGQSIYCTFFSSTCGGHTQPASAIGAGDGADPLTHSVSCTACRRSPYFTWGPVSVSLDEIDSHLRRRYARIRELGPIRNVQVVTQSPWGRIESLAVVDADGRSVTLRGEDFRLAVDPTGRRLRSTFVSIRVDAGVVHFEGGRGFGHGVGLCQWGAEGLARAGWPAHEILAHYYPGSRLTLAYR